jgi:isopenicillin N synthase-like dioxygenase
MAIPLSRRLDFAEIPVIDVAPLVAGRNLDPTIAALGKACSEVGFLYVANHGVPERLIARMAEQAALFFALPGAEKAKLTLDQRMRGYIPLNYRSYEGEGRAGTSHQEGFWIGHERPISSESFFDGPNRWPEQLPELKTVMLAYFAALEQLSAALLRGFALALGLDSRYFEPIFAAPMSRLKLNHYPPQDAPERDNDIGVVPHADSGGFTILWQDENDGLEVQSKSGDWVGAPPIAGTFVINIGNVMQTWSNGRFSSTPHRVINRSGRDRFSIPLFVNPNHRASIKPLIGEPDPGFTPSLYGDYQRAEWRRIFPIAKIPA